jgi:hypothetical protein
VRHRFGDLEDTRRRAAALSWPHRRRRYAPRPRLTPVPVPAPQPLPKLQLAAPLPVHQRSLPLRSGGRLTVTLVASIFDLSPADRAFLTDELIPLLDVYEEGGAAPQTS